MMLSWPAVTAPLACTLASVPPFAATSPPAMLSAPTLTLPVAMELLISALALCWRPTPPLPSSWPALLVATRPPAMLLSPAMTLPAASEVGDDAGVVGDEPAGDQEILVLAANIAGRERLRDGAPVVADKAAKDRRSVKRETGCAGHRTSGKGLQDIAGVAAGEPATHTESTDMHASGCTGVRRALAAGGLRRCVVVARPRGHRCAGDQAVVLADEAARRGRTVRVRGVHAGRDGAECLRIGDDRAKRIDTDKPTGGRAETRDSDVAAGERILDDADAHSRAR